MSACGKRTKYHEPFANLAAAILESGIAANDKRFLESDWADTLREICRIDDDLYGGRGLGTRGIINTRKHDD